MTTDNFPADSRQKLCGESAKFTSVAMASQLIGLGEFYAAYLMAWSEACWDTLADELPPVDDSAVRNKLTDWDECIRQLTVAVRDATTDAAKRKAQKALDTATEGRTKAQANFRKQRQRLEGYRLNVPIVRRILANVPTYMMFDDHEITDDWNLTQEWRNRVLGTNLGSTILRNGLVAYAVCQGWGNDPATWAKGDNKKLLDNAVKLFAFETIDPAARDEIDACHRQRRRHRQGDLALLDRLRSASSRRPRHPQPTPAVATPPSARTAHGRRPPEAVRRRAVATTPRTARRRLPRPGARPGGQRPRHPAARCSGHRLRQRPLVRP